MVIPFYNRMISSKMMITAPVEMKSPEEPEPLCRNASFVDFTSLRSSFFSKRVMVDTSIALISFNLARRAFTSADSADLEVELMGISAALD